MCGIAGIAGINLCSPELEALARAMVSALKHRGPDDSGVELPDDGVALIHTRLAILDLSAAGHQPMKSADSRYTIVFNGEIYNFRELQTELQQRGKSLKSNSDTEVILELFALDGAACVDRLEGMFAFAIWDSQDQSLFLARDPLGIKPLYVWHRGAAIAFASEAQALLKADLGTESLSAQSLYDFFRFGTVQEPATLIANVTTLEPGTSMTWRRGVSEVRKHWSLKLGSDEMSLKEATAIVRESLLQSIERHFVSDVPVGIFLSGGIDSTAILALARVLGKKDLRTFCISFGDPSLNEGTLAAKTAKHFETQHTDWRMTAEDGRSLVHEYVDAQDRPSNDGFNTYCISQLANRSGMKVVLSGVGGDELFGGYPSFQTIPRLLKLHKGLMSVGGSRIASWLITKGSNSPRMRRLAEFLVSSGSVTEGWAAMRGIFSASESLALVREYAGATWCPAESTDTPFIAVEAQPTVADQISACELTGYMRNQLLRDSDVMSMHFGLELRTPFVDRVFVDAVSRIPARMRLMFGKQILRDAVPEIPEWIINQPKRGFVFPFETWAENEWSETFREVCRRSPVEPVTWYRKWCLFVLDHFMQQTGLKCESGASR